MKGAIIGAGFAGNVHAEAMRACGVEISAIICLEEQQAKDFAEKWEIPIYGEDVALALQSEIDVVHICTPPTTHGELIKRALKAGKHVVCEKPLCLENEEAQEIIELEKETGKKCTLMLNVRYHMACQKAKQVIESGELGKVLMVHGNYMQEFSALPAPFDWRYNATVAGKMRTVTELGTHWFDIVQYVSGEKVERVSAQFGKFNKKRILKDGYTYPLESEVEGECVGVASEDAAIVNLQCSNGVIGSVVLSGVSQGRGNRLSWEITCQNGNVWWNEEENNVLSIAKKGQGICQKMFAFGNGFSDTFATLIKSFYMGLENNKSYETYPSFDEGAKVCRICNAIYDSSENDSKWVEVQ